MLAYFWLGTVVFTFAMDIPYSLYIRSNQSLYYVVLLLLFGYFAAGFFGVILSQYFYKSVTREHRRFGTANSIRKSRNITLNWFYRRDLAKYDYYIVFICLLSPIFVLLSVDDTGQLISRSQYYPDFTSDAAAKFADLFFWIGALSVAFVRRSTLKYFSLLLLVLAFSSTGARQAPVAIFLFIFVERFVLLRRRNIVHAVLGLLMLLLLTTIMAIRTYHLGGLVEVFYGCLDVLTGKYGGFATYSFNYMTSYSVVINAEMFTRGYTDTSAFLYALSPVPSFIHNWSEQYELLSHFRPGVPYPGFAYAIKHVGAVIFLFAVFLLFVVFEALRKKYVTKPWYFERALYALVVIVPVFFALQYNLRTFVRLWMFMLILYFGINYFYTKLEKRFY